MADNSDASSSFERQRRDLFVISAILLLAQLADVPVPHILKLSWIDLEIRNAAVLGQAAWWLWFYWFVRYFQATGDLPKGTIPHSYHNVFPERAIAISRPRAIKLTSQAAAKTKGLWYSMPPEPMTHGGTHKSYNVRWKLLLGDMAGNTTMVPGGEYTDNFRGARLKILNLRILLYVIFRTKTFTEYIFPPLFAVWPAAIWASKNLDLRALR